MSQSDLLPADVRAAFEAATGGSGRIVARVSWLNDVASAVCVSVAGEGEPSECTREFRVGLAMKLGCPDCIEVWAVRDWEIDSDWVVR